MDKAGHVSHIDLKALYALTSQLRRNMLRKSSRLNSFQMNLMTLTVGPLIRLRRSGAKLMIALETMLLPMPRFVFRRDKLPR